VARRWPSRCVCSGQNFDGSGRWRASEQGSPIDAHGVFEGTAYSGSEAFARVLANSSALESCLIDRVYSYGLARALTAADRRATEEFRRKFEQSGRRLPALLRLVATADEFYQLEAPAVSDTRRVAGGSLLSETLNGEAR